MFGKINDAYDSIKNGLEAQIALATAEQKESLADAKLALAELKDLMAELKDENRTLHEKLKQQSALNPEKGHEWLVMEDDQDPERRYCAVCFYDRDKIIPLDRPSTNRYYIGQRYCPFCKTFRS